MKTYRTIEIDSERRRFRCTGYVTTEDHGVYGRGQEVVAVNSDCKETRWSRMLFLPWARDCEAMGIPNGAILGVC